MPMRRDSSQTGLLKRAGWSLLNSGSQASLKAPAPERQWEAEGLRLVREVASCWSEKYIFTIRNSGPSEGAYHYECLFSRPTDDKPVPGIVVAVRFALIVLPTGAPSALPIRLFYSFEEADLRHEWALEQDASGRWSATRGQQSATLNVRMFQRYLDAYIAEKVKVRSRGIDVATVFEASRLPPPPQFDFDEEEESDQQVDDLHGGGSQVRFEAEEDADALEMAEAMIKALKAANMYCDKVAPPASLTELLANIFDAADEEDVGELPHIEVASVLNASLSGFGLEEWDIQQLLASAPENDEGYIMWKPFIQAIPEVIEALRKRREAYKARGLPGVEIPPEAVPHCFEDEMLITVEAMVAAFNACVAEDPSRGRFELPDAQPAAMGRQVSSMAASPPRAQSAGLESPTGFEGQTSFGGGDEMTLVALKRRWARECMESLTERLSPQEALRLMQMLPEDEDGFVQIDDLKERMEHLRTQAFLNALVETNMIALRTHLVLNFRKVGLDSSGKLRIWQIRQALLNADQVCLSRLQIHVLLCLAGADKHGWVDVAIFCGICCVVIPHMCDARIFVETAERLENEMAEMLKERANAELAALGAKCVKKDDDEVKEVVVEVDQDTVEKVLNQVFQLSDHTHANPATLSPETIWRLLAGGDPQVEGCMLSELELCGLAAEMVQEANGEVIYTQLLRRWTPIVFELRKSQLLACYLKDNAAESLGIPEPDFEFMEKMFPLLPAGMQRQESPSSKDSVGKKVSLRGSDSLTRRPDRAERSGSKAAMSRSKSMRPDLSVERRLQGSGSYEVEEFLVKEPPPGRGYGRRRGRLEKEGLVVIKTVVEGRSGTKEVSKAPDGKASMKRMEN